MIIKAHTQGGDKTRCHQRHQRNKNHYMHKQILLRARCLLKLQTGLVFLALNNYSTVQHGYT